MTRKPAPIIPLAEIKLAKLRSGGTLVLGAKFDLPGHPAPGPTEQEIIDALEEAFVDDDPDGGVFL